MAKPRIEPNRRRSLSDPLAAALLPPENESPTERAARLRILLPVDIDVRVGIIVGCES